MKSIKAILTGLTLATLLAFAGNGFAQTVAIPDAFSGITLEPATMFRAGPISLRATDMPSLRRLSDVQLETFLNALAVTPLISCDDLPRTGNPNFYSLQNPDWPPLPGDINGSPVWAMQDFYLLNDLDFDYATPARLQMTSQTMGAPTPEGGEDPGGGGTNIFSPNGFIMPDYGTNLWIAQVALTNSFLAGIGTNTQADIEYEIQSRTNLLQIDWQSEGSIYGSELTNWTPLSVAQNGRTNLFIRLKSWADSTGSGLPDWWQWQYFGTNNVDPYGNPKGDGWNNLQKFQNGWNPTNFYTPAAPQGLALSYNANNNTASLNWLPSPGMVIGYTVQKDDYMGNARTYNLPASTTSFSDSNSLSNDFYTKDYSVQADYDDGDSDQSVAYMWNISEPNVGVINGAEGYCNFILNDPPQGLSALKIHRASQQYNIGGTANYWPLLGSGPDYPADLPDGDFYIPISSFTNGIAAIPAGAACNFGLYDVSFQYICSNGVASAIGGHAYAFNNVFADGRAQIKDNLRFRLRAASQDGPFEFCGTKAPTNLVYAGIYDFINDIGLTTPFVENNEFRNFVFDTNNLVTTDGDDTIIGMPNTGALYISSYDSFPVNLALSDTPQWAADFAGFITTNGLPAVPASLLDASQTQWILPATPTTFFTGVPAGYRNYFGLTIVSELFVNYTNNQFYFSTAGSGAPPHPWADGVYLNVAQPELQTAGYYFARTSIDPQPEDNAGEYLGADRSSVFSTTNTTPFLLMSVGGSLEIAGYAKLAVLNGNPGLYAYLGQYFDKAYKMDANGNVTTNTTGILSPYGNFFATEPGPTALVTMPDIDTGERGTCTVYSVSLQLDANHDGNMDLSFNGADATSLKNPAIAWCDNNYDRRHPVDGSDFEQDDLSPAQIANLNVPAEQQVPDCQYKTNGLNAIPCTRDLEDYFRLWTPGLAAMMKVLPANYTVQLKLTGNGQIRIFQAVESNGGTNYLFDESIASNQVANSTALYVGRLTSSSPIIFNIQTNFNEHFIFCGVQIGGAQIDLQVLDGNGNVIADAPTYLQSNEIKQMYERWTVGEIPTTAPNSVATWQVDNLAFQYPPPTDTDTPYILFVHGWNMETWEKDRYAESAYKRLYWQGYKGRFGIFQWPTDNNFGPIGSGSRSTPLNDPKNYDNSESNAWASATGLANLLAKLNAEYPGHVYLIAHSMGNVVAGEALRQSGNNPIVNVYVAMQGAIPAHCYDPSTTSRRFSGPPDRYAFYWTNGAPCYFNDVTGAGTYVNFFNTNDYALNYWTTDQDFKPDVGYQYQSMADMFLRGGFIGTTLYFPTNTYEIFAYADPAWSYALGAQASVGGAFKVGVAYQEVELNAAPYGFLDTHRFHSAQFRSDNMSRAIFWNTLLKKMNLLP